MKKTIFIALLFLIPSLSLASIDQNLKYGQKNTQVSELQDFLFDKGFLTVSPTGFFGSLTLKAVKGYQASVGVPSTGYVGILTRGAINKELAMITSESDIAEIEETGTTTPVKVERPLVVISTPVAPIIPATSPAPVLPVETPVIITPVLPSYSVVLGDRYCHYFSDSGIKVSEVPITVVGSFSKLTVDGILTLPDGKTTSIGNEMRFTDDRNIGVPAQISGTYKYTATMKDSSGNVVFETKGEYNLIACN